jgi:hypothetical protein
MGDRGNGTQSEEQTKDYDTYDHENAGNHAADFPGLRVAASGRIHGAGIYFFQVRCPHNPGNDAYWSAYNQAEDSKNEDECAAMWFHSFLRLEFTFQQKPAFNFKA